MNFNGTHCRKHPDLDIIEKSTKTFADILRVAKYMYIYTKSDRCNVVAFPFTLLYIYCENACVNSLPLCKANVCIRQSISV